MNVRKSIYALGFAVALATPLATFAGGYWHMHGNETAATGAMPQGEMTPGNADFMGSHSMAAMHAAMGASQDAGAPGNGPTALAGGQSGWQHFHHGDRAMHDRYAAGHMPSFADCDARFDAPADNPETPWGG